MDERSCVKEERTQAFYSRHHAFLTELRGMPAATKEERKLRQEFFRKYPLHDDFQMEAMEAYRPGAYRRFINRMADPGGSREQDVDIASSKNRKDIDGLVFAEAVNEAIGSYTGINRKGEDYGFLACLGLLYRQKAGKASAINDLAESGISDTGIPKKNVLRMLKLARNVREIMQREGNSSPAEEILRKLQETMADKCTRKELELIQALVFHTNVLESISPREDKDGEAMEYDLPDEKDGSLKMEDRETARGILEEFCRNIERKWDAIASAKDLKEQNMIKLFFSSNILKELKLDGNGQPYPKEPAGDEEFYLILEPQGEFLYDTLLFETYLRRALTAYPENFYEVYARLLRRDFDFSDKLIAELLGKNKSSISRARARYVEVVRTLCDY